MTSKFYVYLGGATGPLTKITMPLIADVEETPMVDLRVPISQDGRPSARLQQYLHSVRIEATFGGPGPNSYERDMQALANHLNRGGFVAFTLDSSKTYCSATSRSVSVGDTSLTTGANVLAGWEPLAGLADGDEVVVEDPFPSSRRDVYTVASAATRSVTIDDGIRMDFVYHPLVRERFTWPVLYRGEMQPSAEAFVRSRNGAIYYEFAAELTYCTALAYDVIYGTAGTKPTIGGGTLPGLAEGGAIIRKDTDTKFQTSGFTLEQLLASTSFSATRGVR